MTNPGRKPHFAPRQASRNRSASMTYIVTDACVKYIPNGCDCFGCCHVDTPDPEDQYCQTGCCKPLVIP